MTEEKALRFIPPAARQLYDLLRTQGDTPREAVMNVFVALRVIIDWTPPETKRKQARRRT